MVDKKVKVYDERPTQDPLLDVMLQVLAGQSDRRPSRILTAARGTYLKQALAELVANGWVSLQPAHRFRGDRYHVLDKQRLERIRELVTAGVTDPAGAPARAAFLAGMAFDLALIKELAPQLKLLQRMRIARELRERDWVVKAVNEVIVARRVAATAAASANG